MLHLPAPRRAAAWHALLCAAMVAACGDSGTEPTLPVTVAVSPAAATVGAAGTQTVTATVTNTSNTGVTWVASGGTVAGSGASVTWTAPVQGGSYTVTATSVADPTRSGSATLTVTPVQVAITPESPALLRGEPTTLTATVTGTTGSADVSWSATCGDLTPAGSEAAYLAPGESGSCDVTATSDLDPSASTTVHIAIRSANAVTATDDADDGACTWDHCSLREAIAAANAAADADTLYLGALAASTPEGAAARTPRAPAAVIQPATSLPTITSSLAIIGDGSGTTEIDMAAAAGDDRRALDVSGAAGATVVHVVGVTIRNAVARGGPAIYVRDGAELHTRDVALVDNVAVGAEGGAMLVVGEGTSADLEDTVVEGNETADAGWPGGGISVVAGASLRMVGGRIAGNATKAWGGAIRGFDVRSIELDGTVVDGNRVAAGGAGGGGIFIENPGGARGTVTLTNTTFSNNLSEGNLGGGAVTLRNNLDVTIVGSTFSDNETAGTTDGGALNLSADLDVTVSGSTISGNTAFRGGGLVATGVSVAFDDTRVEGNVGEERGGGLFFWGTTVAEMEGGTVRGNSADVFGGAGIWVQDEATLRLTGTSIAENAVTGGAAGGGIWLGGSATVVATDVELRDNVAAAAGGAYMSGTATHMTFKNVMIEGNQATVYSGGGVFADGSSTLSIVGGTVSGNTAAESGGGVFALGSVAFDVTESRIADNTAGVAGGGLWVRGTTTLEDVFVTGNEAGTNGGALSAGGTTSIQGSTLAGNSAGNRGGAIFFVEGAGGPLLLVNTTLSGNDAVLGGGLGSFGSAELTHVTVLGNQASDAGGGIHLHQITPDRTITLTNTLLAANGGPSGAENCAITAAGGTIASAGGNLADDGTCAALTQATDQTDTDAGLDPELLDNGGPTPTHALLDGSAAIDAGVAAGVDIDQRGFARTGTPDVGAVEAGAEG